MMSCVPSVEPVSTITQRSMYGRTESRQRRITGASFLTIMLRQIFTPGSSDSRPRDRRMGRRPRYRRLMFVLPTETENWPES